MTQRHSVRSRSDTIERKTHVGLPAGLLGGRIGAQAVYLVVDAGVFRVTVAEPASLDGASTYIRQRCPPHKG